MARSRRPRSSRFQLTDRDRRILRFCAEHRFVLAAQVALLEGIGVDAARGRLGALDRAGYLTSERRYIYEPHVYAVTRDGIGAGGSDLSQPRELDPGTYAHDVGVAWLTAAARRGLFGELSAVISERRMRSQDGRGGRAGERGGDTHGVRYIGGGWTTGAGRQLHYPDLTVMTARGRRVAFELELHLKGAARRERILSSYAGDPRFDAVVYLVRTPAQRRKLEESARRVGLEDRLYVQLFHWSGGHEPGKPPAAGRRPPARARRRSSTQAATRAPTQAATRAPSRAATRAPTRAATRAPADAGRHAPGRPPARPRATEPASR